MKNHYDLVVIGSGAGLTVTDYAVKHGLKVALIEKGPFGGTCVNRGCIPSKMLLYPSDLIHTIRGSTKLNIETENVKPNVCQLVRRVNRTVDTLAEKIQKHYERADMIDVYSNPGKFIEDCTIQIDNNIVTGEKFCLAIGCRAKIPDIEGLKGTPYLTSSEALRCESLPKKILIIGGGFISAELGHFYSSMGTEVEIFSRSHFLKKIDEELRLDFLKEFQKSHTVHENTTVNRVSFKNNQFTLHYSNKRSAGNALLIATGTQARSDHIGIENTSIQTNESGFIQVDEYLKTHATNTWALGDCLGRFQFRHMANFEAHYLVDQLLNDNQSPISYPPIPFAMFTHPQLGIVGKTEQELQKEGVKVFTGLAKYEDSDMGKARNRPFGLVKLIFDKTSKRLLSAHIMGDEAATMIHILIAYIQMEAKLDDIIGSVFIHPALPEVISSAAYDAKKQFDSMEEQS